MLAHIVFFTLHDNSDEASQALIDGAKKYLTGHPGEAFFAVGRRNHDLDREVNDNDFDVALHVAFETIESHDAYQVADRHNKFIEELKDNWSKVRVFDSNC